MILNGGIWFDNDMCDKLHLISKPNEGLIYVKKNEFKSYLSDWYVFHLSTASTDEISSRRELRWENYGKHHKR